MEAINNPNTTNVEIQFLVSIGCLDGFVRRLGRLAEIRFVDRNIGFLYASVPVKRVMDALDLGGSQFVLVVRALEHTGPVQAVDAQLDSLPNFHIPIPEVSKDLPMNGPLFPAPDAGLTALRQQFADADGRYVHIAFVDDGIDLLHPALQAVQGANGLLIPKISDIDVTAIHTDQPGWVRFEQVSADQPQIRWHGRVWELPTKGQYSIGEFATTLSSDSPADPRARQLSLQAGVLWDRDHDLIWVDTDGDGNFGNNHALQDYAQSHDLDFFGKTDASGDNRIPFGVKIDRQRDSVFIALALRHGTVVASTAAANRLTGGIFNGAAPQAQIIDVRHSETAIAAMVRAASRPDVDVVNRSGAVGILGANVNHEPFEVHVIKRLVQYYKKPIVCVCSVPGTINVGDYQSVQMMERNRHAPPPTSTSINHIAWLNVEGIENSVVAPSTSLTAESRYAPVTYHDSEGRTHFGPDMYNAPAPAGYTIGANPSPTVSLVSGVVADLITLARLKHVRYDAVRMADAIFTGTSLIPGFPAELQGHGLINAFGAWRQLEAMALGDDPSNPSLTSFRVQRIKDASGPRVYGFSEHFRRPGKRQLRELLITRKGGFAGARIYRMGLRSNDGTFALLNTRLVLQRDQPTPIRFSVLPKPGLHVAYLQLIDQKVNVAMHEIALEALTADMPQSSTPGVMQYQVRVPSRRVAWSHFRLNEKLQAVHVIKEMPDVGFQAFPMQRLISSGDGLHLLQQVKSRTTTPLDALHHHVGPLIRYETLITDPAPGFWRTDWDNRGRSEYETAYDPPAPDVAITGSLTLKKISVSLWQARGHTVMAWNRLAAARGNIEFLEGVANSYKLNGSGAHGTATAAAEVSPGTEIWRITITSIGGSAATSDVYLLHCGAFGCSTVRRQTLVSGRATLSILRPHAGSWRIIIMQRFPNGPVRTYRMQQVVLGLVRTNGGVALPDEIHPSGQRWRVGIPAAIRKLPPDHAAFAAFCVAGEVAGEDDYVAFTPLARVAP